MRTVLLLFWMGTCASLLASGKKTAPADTSHVTVGDTSATVRGVNEHDIVPILAARNFDTIVVFPKGTEILEVSGGDYSCSQKDMPPWFVCAAHGSNVLHVKPTSKATQTNANVLLKDADGSTALYSFKLIKVTDGTFTPKVFIEPEVARPVKPKDTCDPQPLQELSRQLREEKALTDKTSIELTAAQHELASKVDPAKQVFDYKLDKHAAKEPFNVVQIWHDDKNTYIRSTAKVPPAIYVLKDGKAQAVPFQSHDGLYTIYSVVDHGMLQVGKRTAKFDRQVN